MKEPGSTRMSHYEFVVPRDMPHKNWCWIACGVISIIVFIAGWITYTFFR